MNGLRCHGALAALLVSCAVTPLLAQTSAAPSPPGQTSVAASASAGTTTAKIPDWQIAAGGKMEFDVASVKQDTAALSQQSIHSNIPLGPQDLFSPTGGLLSAANFPLFQYMIFAYKLTPDQVKSVQSQLPKWATANRYDIEGRVEGNPTKDQFRLAMQELLADRFKLAIHYETRQLPVLALVLDKLGKLGPRLSQHPADAQCSTAVSTGAASLPTVEGGFPEPCGGVVFWPSGTAQGRLMGGARDLPLSKIAETFEISPFADSDKPIIDKTGLSGTFDFALEFSPDLPPGVPFQADPNGPTFQEALKEQLGLKFEQQTGPVDVIVIDHVEQPSEN